MYFDRYDILAAWDLWLTGHHTGQWSPEYKRHCQLRERTGFYPSPSDQYFETLSENAQEIYRSICERVNDCEE